MGEHGAIGDRDRGRFDLYCLWYLDIISLVQSRSERGGEEERQRGESRRGEAERRVEESDAFNIPLTSAAIHPLEHHTTLCSVDYCCQTCPTI